MRSPHGESAWYKAGLVSHFEMPQGNERRVNLTTPDPTTTPVALIDISRFERGAVIERLSSNMKQLRIKHEVS